MTNIYNTGLDILSTYIKYANVLLENAINCQKMQINFNKQLQTPRGNGEKIEQINTKSTLKANLWIYYH